MTKRHFVKYAFSRDIVQTDTKFRISGLQLLDEFQKRWSQVTGNSINSQCSLGHLMRGRAIGDQIAIQGLLLFKDSLAKWQTRLPAGVRVTPFGERSKRRTDNSFSNALMDLDRAWCEMKNCSAVCVIEQVVCRLSKYCSCSKRMSFPSFAMRNIILSKAIIP